MAKKTCCTMTVHRLAPNSSPGVINREWHDTEPVIPIAASTTAAGRDFRLSHDFSLPTTVSSVITNLNLNDTDNTAGELDVQVLDTVITVPAGGIWIQYQGGSEGYWAIEVGQCCGPLQLMDELGYADRLNSLAIVGPVFLPEGQHQFRAWNIDSGGTNSSHAVRYSTDGTTFGTAVPAGVELSTEKRQAECEAIPCCDLATYLADGWSECPLPDCLAEVVDPFPVPPVASSVVPASVLPIPDNEVDTAIRTGIIGTSLDYARADHNHPIRRQANPGDITLTAGGNAVLLSGTVILDRWSTEETYEYNVRVQVSQVAGIGWGWLNVPTIAGFQQPQISERSYRSDSGIPQNDNAGGNSAGGASPRGPFMGKEVNHWSSTNRLYFAYYRRDNAITSMYVEAVVRYIRL